MAVEDMLSGDVPSPQLTVIPVTLVVLETAKFRTTVDPVLAGLGVGPLTVTTGEGGGWTVTTPVARLVIPVLSITVSVTVNEPGVEYEWYTLGTVEVVPSPKFQLKL